MSFSIYAYFDPTISKARIPYWDHYFSDRPWVLSSADGFGVFTYTKPRLEDGDQRFIDFMFAVREADEYLLEIIMDDWPPYTDLVIQKLKQHGFSQYVELIRVDDDSLNLVYEGEYANFYTKDFCLVVNPIVMVNPPSVEKYFQDFLLEMDLLFEDKTMIDRAGTKWYCPNPDFLLNGESVCFYRKRTPDYMTP
jgi:hypothetical protein